MDLFCCVVSLRTVPPGSVLLCSIFENGPIPYPKREFLTDDENEDKMDTATSKVVAAVTDVHYVCNVFLDVHYSVFKAARVVYCRRCCRLTESPHAVVLTLIL